MTGRKRQNTLVSRSKPALSSTRGRAAMLATILVLIVATLLPRLASAADPYSSISPESQDTRDIQLLYKIIFWIALVVFIGVQAAIVFTVMKYRQRRADEPRPEQIHGNQRLEVLWTIIPAIVLVAIFIPTVRTMFQIDDRASNDSYVIEVYGKQWWWEVHYKEPQTVANVITANEIYIPVNTRVRIELNSTNVIHSFYVPQLAGKMDVIPGHTNAMSVEADQPGMYYGECAEYCGDSHAYMRFKIMAVAQDQFDLWVQGWNQGADSSAAALTDNGDVDSVPSVMALCLGCHRIGGVPNGPTGQPLQDPPNGLAGGESPENMILGPNLSMLACRTTIAAGILPNNEESLHRWIHNPGAVKQGNFMATMIKEGTVKDEDITKIVAYLETLKPEGGCPVITGVNADKVHRLADDGGGGTTGQGSSDSASSITGPAPTPEIGYVNEARFKS
jgi:cytochrome c oxidase subunit 2